MKKGQHQEDTPVYSAEEMAERFIPVLENIKQLANTLNEANKGILEMYDAFMQLVNNEGLLVRAKM